MKYEHLPYDKSLKGNAKTLRKNMTRHERHLWYDFLRSYPIKIYRQKIISNYIVDFYCDKAHLAIELDGGQHYEEQTMEYDERRASELKENGITVVRISNLEIDRNFNGVCDFIHCTIQNLIQGEK